MPYTWTEPELRIDYERVQVYYTYRDDYIDITNDYHFTTAEWYSEGSGLDFDIRDIVLDLGYSVALLRELDDWQILFEIGIDAGLITAPEEAKNE